LLSNTLRKDIVKEGCSSHLRWEEVRTLAKAALVSFGWRIEIPPPAPEENGMIVDYGAYFIKGKKSS
jgi:hypothetical protein